MSVKLVNHLWLSYHSFAICIARIPNSIRMCSKGVFWLMDILNFVRIVAAG
jgi:hypothetical protein